MQYTETRCAHALKIDMAITAKKVYDSFSQEYIYSPNSSDVEGYGTRGNKGVYVPPPELKEKEKATGEYVPTEHEKAELLPYFYQLNPIEQHKDLLVTKNIIKRKSEVGKWKNNPKYYDIRNIDTQPEELVEERINIVKEYVGSIPITPESKINKIKSRTALAGYAYQRINPKDLGKIIIRPKKIKNSGVVFSHNKVIAHELGHAYDRNVFGKGSGLVGNINIGYDVWNKIPKNIEKRNLGFGKTNNLMVDLGRKSYKEVWKPVEELTRKKLFPYNLSTAPRNFHKYRQQKEELFANWFSGFVTQKNVVKKKSSHFYNIFKKQNKPLFRDLRKSDFNVTRKYIGGKKVSSWRLF